MELKAAGLYNSSGTQLVNTSGKALTASNISGFSDTSMAMFASTSTTGGVRIAGKDSINFDFNDGQNESTEWNMGGNFDGRNNDPFSGGSVLFYANGYNTLGETGIGMHLQDMVLFNLRDGNNTARSNDNVNKADIITGASGDIYQDDSMDWSDDRLKHNEKIVTNALDDIRKLVPMKYFKTRRMYDANHHFELDNSGNPIDNSGNPVSCKTETGFIAQSVLKIEELKHSVKKKEGRNNLTGQEYPHAVNYKYIFVHAIAALKELDAEHTSTKQELESLKTKVADLESKVELLMNERNV